MRNREVGRRRGCEREILVGWLSLAEDGDSVMDPRCDKVKDPGCDRVDLEVTSTRPRGGAKVDDADGGSVGE